MLLIFEDLKGNSTCLVSWSKKVCGRRKWGWEGTELAESSLYGLGSGNVSFMELKIVFIVKYVTPRKNV